MMDIYGANKRIRELRDSLELGRAAFEAKTGIDRKTIANIEQEKQKVYALHIEQISKVWPEFGYWLATGKVLPEAGQISPELEKIREDSGRAGKAG
jgi:transcriptional regulator with XRE-family HTH domain